MGHRQVGKSTVVKQVINDTSIPCQLFLADNVPATNSVWVLNCWAAVRSLQNIKNYDSILLVIDEIQKITNWSEAVEWDDDIFNNRNIGVIDCQQPRDVRKRVVRFLVRMF